MSLLLIDGYNIINSLPLYKSLVKQSLEEARIRLIEDLVLLQSEERRKVVVVFDAARGRSPVPVTHKVEGMEVVFTAYGKSADAYIEKRAFQEAQCKQVYVATSDYYQQMLVFSKGVLRMTPKELAEEISQAKERIQGSLSKRSRMILEERIDKEVREALSQLVLKTEEPGADQP